MKRTLLIIASALFIAFMLNSCVSCENKDGQTEEQNNTTTVEPEVNVQPTENVKTEEPKVAPKNETSSVVTTIDIEKVNKLIREGKCEDAAKEIKTWTNKEPAKGVSILRDVEITYNNNECAKIVGDAINELGEARRKNAK